MEPKLVTVPDRWAERIGHGRMLVPTPLLVDKAIRKIPKGKLATVNLIRDYLANTFQADMTCPLTSGIFLNIAANAAEEDKLKGQAKVTPYWRVLKEGGELNPKFPGGITKQSNYLVEEGFEIVPGKKKERLFVKGFEKRLADIH